MLVAMMMRMQAISQMNRAQFSMMQNRMGMMNMMRKFPSFGGNMQFLSQMDEKFALNNAQNETLYLMAQAQAKAAKQLMVQEAKDNKISYIA